MIRKSTISKTTPSKSRRNHAARGARIIALVSSVLTTGGVAGAMAYSDGALFSTEASTETDKPAASSAPQATTSKQSTGELADGIWLGTASYTKWGDVQVEVTIESNQITDVATIQIPSDSKSTRINDRATPILETQAISIQSADLDTVSGATYTSIGYADSLQAALDESATAQQLAAS